MPNEPYITSNFKFADHDAICVNLVLWLCVVGYQEFEEISTSSSYWQRL